jgi:hypothetical protein
LFDAGGTQTVTLNNNGSFLLRSGSSGSRVELDLNGLRLYNGGGGQTFNANATNGEVDITGRLASSTGSGARLVINPNYGVNSEIRFYKDATEYSYITTNITSNNDSMQLGTVPIGDRKGVIHLFHDRVSIYRGNTAGQIINGLEVLNPWIDLRGLLGQPGAASMVVRGSPHIGGFGTGWNIFYGGTLDSDVFPVFSFFDVGGNHYSAKKDGGGASSFSIEQSGPSSVDPHEITYFGWRM